ncbi:hypothetical protein SAMD00024442_60_13 [Candidatus Symbiothrix dinenymphae]|nr:hypothetical protein SAMD00024442_17_22 [Candidatus Symbiothrix dinenymphae]GAP73131.1 hypothetical protein SAMD00024442_60_13 [Candidatus Symbiothrix dinenymphae]
MKNLEMWQKNFYYYEFGELLKEKKVNIGIDKLKLCYSIDDDTIIKELEEMRPELYPLFNFDLRRIDGKYHSDVYQILIKDLNKQNELETVVFGELRFNLKEEDEATAKEKKVWLWIENKVLYDKTQLWYLPSLTSDLGLSLRNVTELEIYIDSTHKNIPNLLKRCIRDKNMTTVLNGKVVHDRKADRPEIVYTHSGNMEKYKTMTLNIYSKKALNNKLDGISICSYNKVIDCQKKGKNYILEQYDDPKILYRTEIRVGNEKFKEYVNKNRIELYENLFCNKGFLYCTFVSFFDKVIYFIGEKKERFTVADILL